MKRNNSISGNKHLQYHITANHGLINDPCGLIKFRGKYHVFYQWNQQGVTHDNKSWGHLISEDLLHWDDVGCALQPDQYYDKDGCYTGCAIEHDNIMYLFYTGNVKGKFKERITYQCLATSNDGINFEKKGPIIDIPLGYTGHIRDPKVWKGKDRWFMILGAQREDKTGTALIYDSIDLFNWNLSNELLEKEINFGYMWECPNLVKLNNKEVFIFSPQGIEAQGEQYNNEFQSGYLLGKMKDKHFIVDSYDFKELDCGFEFYAPQFFEDDKNRILYFGWMGYMLPEKEASFPTVKDGWLHMLTIPRTIELKNGQLIQKPIDEFKQLRNDKKTYRGLQEIVLEDFACELNIENIKESFQLIYRNEVVIEYDAHNYEFSITRTDWETKKRESRKCRLLNTCNTVQIFLEETSMEIFINKGEKVFSLRYITMCQNSIKYTYGNSDIITTVYKLGEGH